MGRGVENIGQLRVDARTNKMVSCIYSGYRISLFGTSRYTYVVFEFKQNSETERAMILDGRKFAVM